MSPRRTLSLALVLILAAAPAVAEGVFQFSTPLPGDIVVGQTPFAFEVSQDEPVADRIDVYVEGELIGSALPPEWSFSWLAPADGAVDAEIVAVAYSAGRRIAVERMMTSAVRFGEILDVASVQLYPVVRDRGGRYIGGLTRDDFVIYDQGKEVEINFFSDDPAVLTVALLLDISESMTYDLGLLKEAACGFIDQLDADDSVSAFAFNNALTTLSSSSRDHHSVMSAIRRLSPGGGTALFDATLRVLEKLSDVPNRKALVVFSDGEDRSSLTTLDRAVREARRSDVLIYTIGVEPADGGPRERRDLEELGKASGGEAFLISKLKNLPRVFEEVLEDLRAQYILSYPPPPGETGQRSVRVELRKKRGQVRCRESYFHESHD